ncbi:MAG: hypothetical protein AAGH99_02540 [Planctomycetota bacterium]
MKRHLACWLASLALLFSTAFGVEAAGNETETADAEATFTYVATKDFPELKAGEAPYYVDKWRDVLAINAGNVNFRDKWAKATTEFAGDDGTYDVTITTIGEFDGESTYRLYVDGELVGEHQNTAVDKSGDMKPQTHVWKGVAVKKGQTIGVESNPHTNGKIPEGDGTAWARGRWQQLEFSLAGAS